MALSRRRVISGLGLVAGSPVLTRAESRPSPKSEEVVVNPILGKCGVHHAGIVTREWDRTMAFYQKGLGFRLKASWSKPPYRTAYLDAGDGSCIEVNEVLDFVPPPGPATMEAFPTKVPINHFCLHTEKIDAAIESVRAIGGGVITDLGHFVFSTITPNGPDNRRVRTVFLEGPSGEWVELLENAP